MDEPMSDQRLAEIEMTWRWPGSSKEWRDDIRDLLAEVRRLRLDTETREAFEHWAGQLEAAGESE